MFRMKSDETFHTSPSSLAKGLPCFARDTLPKTLAAHFARNVQQFTRNAKWFTRNVSRTKVTRVFGVLVRFRVYSFSDFSGKKHLQYNSV